MTTETNAAALQRAGSAWNAGDLEGYLKLYADDAILQGYAGVDPGLPAIRRFYEAFWAAFGATRLEFLDVFTSGDRIACRFEVSGTHVGSFQGLPATGRSFAMPGITILRFTDGKCVERWSQADFLGLMQQLGALPPPS